MAGDGDLTATFRSRAVFMKTWKAATTPSNRDRLELYALHKQAVSGDAPATVPTSASAPERAKYQAWRSKSGLDQSEAMRLYLQESDRQLRVYGTTNPQTPETTPNNTNNNSNTAPGDGGNNNQDIPRGLAAIPLLCAAAAESRPAYLRRIAQTPLENAWWGRQEALCDSPAMTLPETLLIQLARMIEFWSISSSRVVAALLWPVHNSLLSVWVMLIVILQLIASTLGIVQVLIWGARRTGLNIQAQMDHLLITGQSVNSMAAPHQALTCRLVGMALWPLPLALSMLNVMSSSIPLAVASTIFVILVACTWWYWLLVVPWLAACLLGVALSTGTCFALIEFADSI